MAGRSLSPRNGMIVNPAHQMAADSSADPDRQLRVDTDRIVAEQTTRLSSSRMPPPR